jgi:hypothetical protein
MSRQRRKMLTTGAITSRKLASVTSDTERVYWRVYMASDMYGTMDGDPWDVWQQALPGVTGFTESLVADCVDRLVAIGLLQRFDAEGSTWLHVVNHDRHQSSEFVRKRGKRATPVPPEHVGSNAGKAGVGPALGRHKGSEGPPAASQAEGRPTRELSAPTVSVSVSGSVISTTPPPVERPPAHVRARQSAVARADDEVAAVHQMTTALTRVADEGTAAGAAEALMFRSSKRHPSAGMILPLAQWVAAVDAFVAKVESGWTAPAGDLVGYIIGMVPTAGAALTIDESKVRVVDEAEVRRAEQLAKLDAMYGGTQNDQ